MNTRLRKLTVAVLAFAAGIGAAGFSYAADTSPAGANSPTDPNYMSPTEKAYWAKQMTTMTSASGMVTKESFLDHYAKLWDANVPSGKSVTVQQLTDKWAAQEGKDALDPKFQSILSRREHVATIDADKDGTITRDEFLTHMELHWAELERKANSAPMTPDAVTKMLRSNPLDPSYHHM